MKFTILEKAWLEELGVFEEISASSPAIQKSWKVRATSASARVRNHFRELSMAGEMKEVNQGYKQYRKTEKRPMSYGAYVTHQQVEVIKQFAAEQITRAGRGESVE